MVDLTVNLSATTTSTSGSSPDLREMDAIGMHVAITHAKKSAREGGVPIGAALTYLGSDMNLIIVASHNQRVQRNSAILHGEMAVLERAGRMKAEVYRRCTMYTTLSPCDMCTGAILLYKIPRVVIGENANFMGAEDYLRARGVEVLVVDDRECKDLMESYIKEHPEDWNEDIGET